MTDDEFRTPRWLTVAAVFFGAAIVGAVAFAYFEPVQVLPRLRLAPGFALTDQAGDTYTSESARGVITVYTFAPAGSDCEGCDRINKTMTDVAEGVRTVDGLEEVDLRLVTVALDTADPTVLAEAARRSGADGRQWRWVGGEADRLRTVVGAGFEQYYEVIDPPVATSGSSTAGSSSSTPVVEFDPAFVLVDGNGIVRGDYSYQTLAGDADKIVSHLEILADEIRYANGAAAVAYEAAHLFLCYP